MDRYNIQIKIRYHLKLLKDFYGLMNNSTTSLKPILNNIIASCDNIKSIAESALETTGGQYENKR